MATRVQLNHHTSYRYEKLAALGPHTLRLRPAPHNRTPVHSYALAVTPRTHFLNWQQDPHGNHVARLVFPERSAALEVDVELVVDLEAYNPFDFFVEPEAEQAPFAYTPTLESELSPYLAREPLTLALSAFIETLDRRKRATADFLVDINRALHSRVGYVIRMEPGVQTPEQTLTLGRGSCRDSAWLLIQVFRHLGLAARFVSGYLIQLTADQPPLEGPKGPERDFCDLHAWCEVFVPGAGWIGLDPTSGLLTAEGHVPLACTPSPASAAPIEGLVEKVEAEFAFSMSVRRLLDIPRVTKPYEEAHWQGILALGARVDESLNAQGVPLSMGGEPTFVSSLEPDAPEWNTEALGGSKERLGDRLMRRLWRRWQPGGVLHHGQGKWYPGEQLPRWSLSCFFRRDGTPLWQDERWISTSDSESQHGAAEAERFLRQLCLNLNVPCDGLLPAYEDPFYYAWRERRLPVNVSTTDNRLEDAVERARLTRIFGQGLGACVGFVLPLGYSEGWQAGKWFLREEHCWLLPGDSAMGYRLPLDSLPFISEVDRALEPHTTLDPFAPRGPLPQPREWPLKRPTQPREALQRQTVPAPLESARGVVRTALCVEPREGRLRVFLPPLPHADAYVELISAIERTARQTELPVQLEGYEPPTDARLGVFRITPDPGVLEVNVPPVSSFPEAVRQTEELYEEARREHLIAEKFELDGIHIGSGGGYHLVLGALEPEESPFLRRPQLLASLIRYFHNHPSLSFLFSGRFIGPTSQAPRVDEAREDSVYELSLALKQLPKEGSALPFWQIDRVLRHLLVDVTGNTHRTQLCIDKLYSPDGPAGRLGLVELRAFEMPPHERMAVAQQLLVRALVAAFCERPYEQELVPWGTQIHDRFLLPHFVKQDLHEVLSDLERWGFPADARWFEPHYQFRFPFLGRVVKDSITLELRAALEPWHVLGEENAGSATARYVDSSLERLQVRAFGLTPERHVISCNGVELPLQPTGTEAEALCGVRYRAWQPPSCLHPLIGVHSPLHFDIFDRWNSATIAGATYHVVHPGGRASLERPVNAQAAESRRIARFEARTRPASGKPPRPPPANASFPYTLDLRAC